MKKIAILFLVNLLFSAAIVHGQPVRIAYLQSDIHQLPCWVALEKGFFENFEKSIYYSKEDFHRNAALTNIAPTGTTSLIFDVSSGIEPYFALSYERSNKTYINKILKKTLEEKKLYTEEVIDEIKKNGSIQKIEKIPQEIKEIFVTSMDIAPIDHILMQKVCQKHCDNSISKTINMQNNTTVSDVSDAFIKAYKEDCKSITIYRNDSRKVQVLNIKKKKKEDEI